MVKCASSCFDQHTNSGLEMRQRRGVRPLAYLCVGGRLPLGQIGDLQCSGLLFLLFSGKNHFCPVYSMIRCLAQFFPAWCYFAHFRRFWRFIHSPGSFRVAEPLAQFFPKRKPHQPWLFSNPFLWRFSLFHNALSPVCFQRFYPSPCSFFTRR